MKYFITVILIFVAILLKSQEIREDGLCYLNGKLFTGTFNEHYEDGTTLKSSLTVKNGQAHGKNILYYADGNIKEIRSYKNSQKHGKWLKYNENQVLISSAIYKKNLKHGHWKIWNDSGILLYDMYYTNGQKSGEWKMYNENGELRETKKY
ncbi:MAG: toxin-antitoxin system YwqK family antitoxin [Bacteroidales bacterium]|nr:toxin-antitoxin system YwqK family antitoxin [Bacteroidales bacterium]MDD3860769.1 toxin-antitoxin system YwqK family antitoxin [Bacteroidales bacterium]